MKTIIRITALWILAGFICYLIGLPTAIIIKNFGWGISVLMGILAFFVGKTEGRRDKTFDGDTIGITTFASGLASFILVELLYRQFEEDTAPLGVCFSGIICVIATLIYSDSAKRYFGTALVLGWCIGIIVTEKALIIPIIICFMGLLGILQKKGIGILVNAAIVMLISTICLLLITLPSIWPNNMAPDKDTLTLTSTWLFVGSYGLIGGIISWNTKKSQINDI